jgi:hypothetical protein
MLNITAFGVSIIRSKSSNCTGTLATGTLSLSDYRASGVSVRLRKP